MQKAVPSPKRAPRWLKPVMIGLGLLTAGALVAFAIGRGNSDAAEVQRRLAELRAAGEPVAMDDLARIHLAHREHGDLSREYSEIFGLLPKELPFVPGSIPAKPPDTRWTAWLAAEEPLPEDVLAIYRDFVRTNAPLYRAIEGATDGRFAVFDIPWTNLTAAALERHWSKLRTVYHVLEARCWLNIREGSVELTIRDIDLIMRLSDVMACEPIQSSFARRLGFAQGALQKVQALLSNRAVSLADLARLREIIRRFPAQEDLRQAIASERAYGLDAFASGMPNQIAPGSNEGSATWHADHLLYLKTMTELVAAAEAPFPDTLNMTDAVYRRFEDEVFPSRFFLVQKWHLLRNRHHYSSSLMVANPVRSYAHALALRRMVDAAICIEAHKMNTGSWPEKLDAIIDRPNDVDFTDPYSGNPLFLKRYADGYFLYSVGIDRMDNGGKPPYVDAAGRWQNSNTDRLLRIRTTARQ